MPSPLHITPSKGSRNELLAWINELLPNTAANGSLLTRVYKVEQCGNGVPYVVLLPPILPIPHPPLSTRAKIPANHDFESVTNLKLVIEALQKNGIPRPDILATESDKLIKGAYQANLQFLQWFRGLYDALATQPGSPQQQSFQLDSSQSYEHEEVEWSASGPNGSLPHSLAERVRPHASPTVTHNGGVVSSAKTAAVASERGPPLIPFSADPARHMERTASGARTPLRPVVAVEPQTGTTRAASLAGRESNSLPGTSTLRARRASPGGTPASDKAATSSPAQRRSPTRRRSTSLRVTAATAAAKTLRGGAGQGGRKAQSPRRSSFGGGVFAGNARPATSLLRLQNGKINPGTSWSSNHHNNSTSSRSNSHSNANSRMSGSGHSWMNGGVFQRESDETLTEKTSGGRPSNHRANSVEQPPIVDAVAPPRDRVNVRPVLSNDSTYNKSKRGINGKSNNAIHSGTNNSTTGSTNTTQSGGRRRKTEDTTALVSSPKTHAKDLTRPSRAPRTLNPKATSTRRNHPTQDTETEVRCLATPRLLTHTCPEKTEGTQTLCPYRIQERSEGALIVEMLTTAEKERQFYYDKLRRVELVLLPLLEKSGSGAEVRKLASSLLDILYDTQ